MKRALDDLATVFGRATRESIEQLGSIVLFLGKVIKASPRLVFRFHLLTEQMMRVGVDSLPLITIISVFIGAITVWQAKYFFSYLFPYTYLGAAVGKAVLIDLGPVLTALVITGRVGAMLAAELGTMKVTEQVDAMQVLSLDPLVYLLSPRVLAGFIMMPILGVYASFLAIVSAQILATLVLDVNPAVYYNSIKILFSLKDVLIFMVKAFVFGGIIALCGTYYGYLTHRGGAQEVGQSTNRAVVAASTLILIANLIVMAILL